MLLMLIICNQNQIFCYILINYYFYHFFSLFMYTCLHFRQFLGDFCQSSKEGDRLICKYPEIYEFLEKNIILPMIAQEFLH